MTDARWRVLAAVLLGTFVGTINNSVANVAVLDVLDEFDVGVGGGVWFVTAYVLAFAVLMPLAGRLADRYGSRRVYIVGLCGFAASTVGVAVAPNYPLAAAARVLQGICNAPVLPTVMLTVATAFPAGARGRAMGVWASVNGAAIAVGPPLGGMITESFGWRAVFWLELPVVVLAVVFAWRSLPSTAPGAVGAPLDLRGAGLLSGGLVGVMGALSQGPELGWSSPTVLLLLLVGVVLLARCWRHCRTDDAPLVDLDLLLDRRFGVLAGVAALQMVVLFGVLFTVPLLLVAVFDHSVGSAGGFVFLLPVTMILAGPLLGHLGDVVGARRLVAVGAGLLTASGVVLAIGAGARSEPLVLAALVLVGAGVSAIQSPAAAGVAEVVPETGRGVAMGLFHTVRFLSGVVGTAVFAAVLTALAGTSDIPAAAADEVTGAFAGVSVVVVVVGVAALLLARLVPDRRVLPLVAP